LSEGGVHFYRGGIFSLDIGMGGIFLLSGIILGGIIVGYSSFLGLSSVFRETNSKKL
jgi:hypothetical protein